jgi:excisionase family DNA binding protein
MIKLGNLIFYTVEEVTKAFGLTKRTVRAYIAKGKLPGRKMGNRYFVSEDGLREVFKTPMGTKKEKKQKAK